MGPAAHYPPDRNRKLPVASMDQPKTTGPIMESHLKDEVGCAVGRGRVLPAGEFGNHDREMRVG